MRLATLRNDPTDSRLPKEPTDPTEKADPWDPIDMTESREATLSNEFDEPMLHRDELMLRRYPSGTPTSPS